AASAPRRRCAPPACHRKRRRLPAAAPARPRPGSPRHPAGSRLRGPRMDRPATAATTATQGAWVLPGKRRRPDYAGASCKTCDTGLIFVDPAEAGTGRSMDGKPISRLLGMHVLPGLLLACLWTGALQAREVELPPGIEQISLVPHLDYRHDSESVDRMDDAFAHARDGRFEPVPGGNATFGFQRGAFWFHATIVNRNEDEQRWLLVQEYPLSDRLDLYVRYADGRTLHQSGGDHLPFDARSVRYRHPNFRLDLPAGEPVELLLRV